jgi:N-acetylglucosaminyl-diphospho-decaprenol L-rhamnosyltransferase
MQRPLVPGRSRVLRVPEQRRPSLDIVLVDYNSGALLAECLASIERHPPAFARLEQIVVVDNASTLPAATFLDSLALPVTVLRNDVNRGFAAACNQGAGAGGADYVLFLNPDTRITAGALDTPLRFLEDAGNAGVGVCGVQLIDERGDVARTCSRHPRLRFYVNRMLGLDRLWPARFPNGFMREWDHSSSRAVDAVMGAFFLVRRQLFERLGGFDERFFVYFEETDFSLRAARQGYTSYYMTEARVHHRGHGSSSQVPRQRLVYFVQSQLTYGWTHFGRTRAAALTVVTLVGEPLARIVRLLWGRSPGDISDVLAAYGAAWRMVLTSRGRFRGGQPQGAVDEPGKGTGHMTFTRVHESDVA